MHRRPQTGAATRQRSISLTDREWTRIAERARAVGVSRSRYVADRALGEKDTMSAHADQSIIASLGLMRGQFDTLLTSLPEHISQVDLMSVLVRLDGIDRRLKQLLGSTRS